MIVRISFLCFVFFLSCACGTSQGPKSNIDLASGNFTYKSLTAGEKEKLGEEIRVKYDKLLGKNFSGEIVVAKNGEIVFEDYKGYANYMTKSLINPETPIHLASISKTFTGMATLKLWEEQKIDLNAFVTLYLPNFPYPSITIEQLLSHRSGLPDYTYFMETRKYVSVKTKNKRGKWVKKLKLIANEAPFKIGNYNNNDVLNFMVVKHPAPQASPNRVFKYCNTNYVILALIIEKITGQDFPTYMSETIFKPLKMIHTYIFNEKVGEKYLPSYNAKMQPYGIEKYDYIYGDKNIYSTARDMFLWDQALTQGKYLSPSTLQMAYEPKSPLTRNFHNYGLGWRMLLKPNEDKLIYHNGWWHGNNTVFTRLLANSATIIILGNRFNKTIYKGKEIASVFTGKQDTTSLVE
jgi:CubicO group peptidase (beta-lactamase class C family)